MNPYPTPSSITMQRTGENPITITLEDAVVIMTNQQKTIEELIANNQRMFQYIKDAQRNGGFGNIQFAQQSLSDPASHISRTTAAAEPVREKPMTLNEYLSLKKNSNAAAATSAAATTSLPSTLSPAPAATTVPPPSTLSAPSATAPMTLSEFLALKKSGGDTVQQDQVPVFDVPSKTEPLV